MVLKRGTSQKFKGGFTLVETMMVMLILTMAAGVVAGGMPAAMTAFARITDSANAQALLSTAMIRLRDELGTAQFDPDLSNVYYPADHNKIRYTSANGSESWLFIPTQLEVAAGTRTPEIYIREYVDIYPASDGRYEYPLLSGAKTNRSLNTSESKLYVTYDDFAYSDGVVKIKGLTVKRGSQRDTQTPQTLASLDNYEIRVLTYLS